MKLPAAPQGGTSAMIPADKRAMILAKANKRGGSGESFSVMIAETGSERGNKEIRSRKMAKAKG
jgi:hypothetical protein